MKVCISEQCSKHTKCGVTFYVQSINTGKRRCKRKYLIKWLTAIHLLYALHRLPNNSQCISVMSTFWKGIRTQQELTLSVLSCWDWHLLLWINRCLCRENGVRNKALHSLHWNGLSSEWVCKRKTVWKRRMSSSLQKADIIVFLLLTLCYGEGGKA